MFGSNKTMDEYWMLWRQMNETQKDHAWKKATPQLIKYSHFLLQMLPYLYTDADKLHERIYTLSCLLENAVRFEETRNADSFAAMCASLREESNAY